jgi:hypothetical protein
MALKIRTMDKETLNKLYELQKEQLDILNNHKTNLKHKMSKVLGVSNEMNIILKKAKSCKVIFEKTNEKVFENHSNMFNFFRINFIYGLAKNKNGEWMAFNREYMPIGYNNSEHKISGFPETASFDLPVYAKYNLKDEVLLKIATHRTINEEGELVAIWLYNDNTNPMNQGKTKNSYWEEYWSKLEILSQLETNLS